MKKVYAKPQAQKVDFSYQDQVVASNYNDGSVYNRDNTGYCQQSSAGCNYTWNVPASGVSLFSMYDCVDNPH